MEDDYKSYIESKSKAELLEIIQSLDKEKYPNRYKLATSRFYELQSLPEFSPESFKSEYANVFTRFGAIVIDGLLAFLFYIPIIITARLIKHDGDLSVFLMVSLISLLGMIVFGIWNSIIRMGKTGQSLGRKFLNIAVLTSGGMPIGIGKAFLREVIGRFISGLFCYIGYLAAFWDKNNQMWHDKMADCFVYYVGDNFS